MRSVVTHKTDVPQSQSETFTVGLTRQNHVTFQKSLHPLFLPAVKHTDNSFIRGEKSYYFPLKVLLLCNYNAGRFAFLFFCRFLLINEAFSFETVAKEFSYNMWKTSRI